MKLHLKSLDDLVIGIKQLLSENRCSFSTEDEALLNRCVEALLQFKKLNEAGKTELGFLIQVTELITKLFVLGINLKDNV